MKKILVVNRSNNMGDCMCQMRGIQEYKVRNSDTIIDFITCHYLHYIVAQHTDNFNEILFEENPANCHRPGYDEVIEFTVDWDNAIHNGILRAWTEKTLHFVPTSDRPYFLLTDEEKITAKMHLRQIMYKKYEIEEIDEPQYKKAIIFQPEAVSDHLRSFLPTDYEKILQMFSTDTAIIYFCPIAKHNAPISILPNFYTFPGYPIGTSAAMMQLVDCVFTVHSGTVMLAYAVNAPHIVHINLLEASGPGILNVSNGVNLHMESNRTIQWDKLQEVINKNQL